MLQTIMTIKYAYDINGTELFTISLMHVKGVVVSDDAKIFCLFRNGLKAYDYSGNYLYDVGGGSGSGDGEFNLNVQVFGDLSQGALAIQPQTKLLYALDGDNLGSRYLIKMVPLSKSLELLGMAMVNLLIPKTWRFCLMEHCWSIVRLALVFMIKMGLLLKENPRR